METQARLPLQIATNVALVDIGVVRAIRGIDAESVTTLAEGGQLRWVWNVGQGPTRRELRFWRLELCNPESTDGLLLPQVVDTILPPARDRFRCGELQALFSVSAQLIHFYWQNKVLTGIQNTTTLYIFRPSLVSFLSTRLLSPIR